MTDNPRVRLCFTQILYNILSSHRLPHEPCEYFTPEVILAQICYQPLKKKKKKKTGINQCPSHRSRELFKISLPLITPVLFYCVTFIWPLTFEIYENTRHKECRVGINYIRCTEKRAAALAGSIALL
jgi:hypothetical protein